MDTIFGLKVMSCIIVTVKINSTVTDVVKAYPFGTGSRICDQDPTIRIRIVEVSYFSLTCIVDIGIFTSCDPSMNKFGSHIGEKTGKMFDSIDKRGPDQHFIIQSFIFLFFVIDFHAAIFVSPFISMAEAVVNAQANFRPLAVNI